jgi:hypothetical protein
MSEDVTDDLDAPVGLGENISGDHFSADRVASGLAREKHIVTSDHGVGIGPVGGRNGGAGKGMMVHSLQRRGCSPVTRFKPSFASSTLPWSDGSASLHSRMN